MNNPRTVEDVIMDFKGRRAGIIKALTKDVEVFYKLCDPNNPNLCLYGFPNQQWEVNLPPPCSDLPEPRLGINFARGSMKKEEWLSMVALHSDAWLHAVASYFAAKFKFDKAERKRLFNKITDVLPIWDTMTVEARKRARRTSDGLPFDMVVEVLARLPVRDLLRYRSVCKKWRALIDSTEFASTHLSDYKGNREGCHLLVVERPKSWLRNEHVLVRRSDTFRKVMEVDYVDGQGSPCDLNYVNGVMLVRRGSFRSFREILLWNPSINKSFNVPDYVFENMREATYFELGLGFDASRDGYKVVAIVYPLAEIKYCYGERYRGTIPGLVQVYTLSTNSWNSNIGVDPPPYWSVGSQVFANGAIHWTSLGPKIRDDSWYTMKDSHIVSFDVSNEVFNYFELPSEINRDHKNERMREKFLIVLDGSLGMFYSYESHHDIWVMEEYGAPHSWSKRYKFALQFDNLLYFKSNGELFFALDGKGMKSYDVKKKWVRDLAKTYCRSSKYAIYTYVESLVLSKCRDCKKRIQIPF